MIDYKKSKFYFAGLRKHFFSDMKYHIHVFDDFMVMGEVVNNNCIRIQIETIRSEA